LPRALNYRSLPIFFVRTLICCRSTSSIWLITFDNSEYEGEITGDIFISIPRIQENASLFKVSETDELHRVIIHGALHLLGYKDKTPLDNKNMTQKEDQYLAKRSFIN
jgi:probable rRNA maturation factor